MRNISLEVEKDGYSGEFYFKAALDMVIYKEKGHMLLRYQLKNAFQLKLYWTKF